MTYTLKITSADAETIEFTGETFIEDVTFTINTVEDNVNDRSSNILNQIIVKGIIVKEDTAACLELLKWACSSESSKIYRTVSIVVNVNRNETIREYEVENVFCEDYTEDFSNSGQGKFELKMTQRKGCLDSIKPY